MHSMTTLFLRALLAFTIAVGAPAALAGPLYRVSLDTATWAGTTGFLDLGLNSYGDTIDAVARVSNFSGDFLAEVRREGDVTGDAASGVTLGTRTGYNFFDQAVNFGGLFSFDVELDSGSGNFGTLFSVALINAAFDSYLGADLSLLTIDLVRAQAPLVTVYSPALIDVAEVPEPAEWLLLGTGLVLLCVNRRRLSGGAHMR